MIRYVGFWGEGKTSVAGKKSLEVKEHQRGFPIRPAWAFSIRSPRHKFLLNSVILTLAEYRPSDLCATYRTSLSPVLRHYSHLYGQKYCLTIDVSTMWRHMHIYLSKNRLSALSAAIWPCSRWKKVPIKWFSCHQNHFSRYFWYLAR